MSEPTVWSAGNMTTNTPARTQIPQEDLWSLDHALAEWIAPRLRGLAAILHGAPTELVDAHGGDVDRAVEAWSALLIEMAKGFEAFLADDGWSHAEQYRHAATLLGKWFGHLWD